MVVTERWSWVVLCSCFFAVFLNGSWNYVEGVLHISLLEAYPDEDPTTIAWLGSLFSSLCNLAGFLVSIVINLYNVRTSVILGAVSSLLGFGLSSVVTDVKYLFLTYGLMAGCGQALCYSAAMIIVGYYFKEKSSMASGIATSGTGLSLLIFPPLTRYLIDSYGLRGAFLLLGAIAFQSAVCGALMRPTKYEDHGGCCSVASRLQTVCQRNQNRNVIKRQSKDNVSVFISPQFWILLLSTFSYCSGLSIVYLYLPNYFKSSGSSSQEAALILSFVGVSGALSRLLIGFMGMIVDPILVYMGIFGIIGIITLFVSSMTSFASKVLYAVLFGLYTGGCWSVHHTIIVQTFGLQKLSVVYGIMVTIGGVGYLTAPPIISSCLPSSSENDLVFTFASGLFLCASVSALSLKLLSPKPDVIVNGCALSEIVVGEINKNKDIILPGEVVRLMNNITDTDV